VDKIKAKPTFDAAFELWAAVEVRYDLYEGDVFGGEFCSDWPDLQMCTFKLAMSAGCV